LAVLLVQLALGIANVVAGLPLAVAAAHNAGAAILLLTDGGDKLRPPSEACSLMSTTLAPSPPSSRIRQFYALTKPRVVSLIVFTAVIGMFLATPGMVPPVILIAATVGIALVAGAAAAVNCLVEQKIDALMTRTKYRPLPRGQITTLETLIFSGIVGGIGLALLYHWCQCADDVADPGHLRRLRRHLYRHPQTDDPAEHRHRRRLRCDAAGTRLGCGDR